jgi:hypothetical protein
MSKKSRFHVQFLSVALPAMATPTQMKKRISSLSRSARERGATIEALKMGQTAETVGTAAGCYAAGYSTAGKKLGKEGMLAKVPVSVPIASAAILADFMGLTTNPIAATISGAAKATAYADLALMGYMKRMANGG